MINTLELEPFQEKGLTNASKILKDYRSVLLVSPTGSGKSVIISEMTYRFLNKNPELKVAIFVHRGELANQIRKQLQKFHSIYSQKIDDKTTSVQQNVRVYVVMVETFDRRTTSQSFIDNFKSVGLLVVDEAHINNFNKIFEHFYDAKRVGFTATALNATKKDPLKNYYQQILIITTPPELIELNKIKPSRGIVPCIEYDLGKVNRSELKTKGKDFDDDDMGKKFSDPYQIQNTLNAYLKYAYGEKTLIFNANIEHSIKMHKACLEAGLNSRHLDSNKKGQYASDSYRRDTFEWFENTPNAILNNVGIATVGNDITSIKCVITNKSTKSLSLFWQMRGRGGRPHIYEDGSIKRYFTHLDMGGNILDGNMGEYDYVIDWEHMFNNPQLPRPSIAPVKTCPECGAINNATARYCTGKIENCLTDELVECGFIFVFNEKIEDPFEREVRQIKNSIDVAKNIEFFKNKTEYTSYREAYLQIATKIRKEVQDVYLDAHQILEIYYMAHQKATEWHKLKGKRKFANFNLGVKKSTIDALLSAGFILTPEEIALVDIT